MAVHPHLTQFISASLDSSVSLWDAETHHIIWTVDLEVSFSVIYSCSTKFNQCMCLQNWVKPIWVGKQTCQETVNFIVKCLIKCKIQVLIFTNIFSLMKKSPSMGLEGRTLLGLLCDIKKKRFLLF